MNALVDTCALLWWLDDAPALSRTARDVIEDSDNALYLSSVSTLEIVVKVAARKLRVPMSPQLLVPMLLQEQGFLPLALEHVHALQVLELPPHHKDPFDRLLVAQAQVHRLSILSPDPEFRAYAVEVVW